jgi:2-polyprenyl-3-methyl-5-hydroxy-6-metoxy-1,4-benzoquinol methylase/glycosyltransferase involved in cell wall biosynthesis
MKITIACGAMPFGPETPSRKSLGGSETAALMMGKALAARGHDVTMFCNLPPEGAVDYFPSGTQHADGVRYVSTTHYASFITINETDLLIAVRDPGLVALPAQAKKKVLWCHDIATVRGMKRALEQMAFTFDEIWTVSEWHKDQIATVTGYPEDRIIALRNGIVEYDDLIEAPRITNQILYAARPERGLENLIRPGGIMEHLPEFKLVVCMYEHFPEHMRDYYAGIFARMKQMPNVEYIGGKSNHDLRQIIAESEAYIYPTQFEETSCILARECIEQGTPFLTTSVGALPETLGDCGIYFEDWLHLNGVTEPERGSDGWCKLFAMFFREVMHNRAGLEGVRTLMSRRDDLFWDGVAEMVEPHLEAKQTSIYSRLYSLMQDGDIIAAMAFADSFVDCPVSAPVQTLLNELKECYAFVNGDMAAYYDKLYSDKKGTQSELYFQTEPGCPRHQAIIDQIAQLPPGATVFEYGCGPGHILGALAKRFPDKKFVGYDFSAVAVKVVNEGATILGMTNIAAISDLPEGTTGGIFDAVICSEVLEHVVEPWKLLEKVENFVKPGGRVILTVPYGPWEPITYTQNDRWFERAHLWLIDREMLMEMVGDKANTQSIMLVGGMSEWLRPIGNLLFTYTADHKPIIPVNPLKKALRHFPRETCAAAVIAYNNADTIVRLLNSLDNKVQFVQFAMGPSTDGTRDLVEAWFAKHRHMGYRIIDVPKIEPRIFGFDDARNTSMEGLEEDFQWALWIDTDEYLSGEIRKYLRPSAMDAYLIAQHHFTVEPRGNPPEIDRPARLIRLDRGFKCYGHIHEHFEVPGGGPGRAILLSDVDIGHPGYVNEQVRQARFMRNFPFLEWEHDEDPYRRLHQFLWFRDIIHRMRFSQEPATRFALAQEAVSWYNDHYEDMSVFGPGLFMSLQYLSEAYALLGRGIPLRVTIQLDDRSTTLEGRFESYEQVERLTKQLLKDEFKERTGRYY